MIQPIVAGKNITVLAFADSDSFLDALVDLKQATGAMPVQYHQELALTRRYLWGNDPNLYLTGHSLGGRLAAYSSATTGAPASTINPAPLVGALTFGALCGNSQIIIMFPATRNSSTPDQAEIPELISRLKRVVTNLRGT